MSTNPGRIGKYELQELVGRGSMTEVWKAFDTQQKLYVAMKFFHPDVQVDSDFVTRFLSEAQIIASLDHPNIVQIHDFQVSQQPIGERLAPTQNPTPYVVMDYIEGQTLEDFIMHTSRMGRFPPAAEIVRLLLPISAALDYAHQRGIVHSDIKPGNILLGKAAYSGTPIPMLTDFAMVQLLKTTGWPLKSAFYVSPEQAQGYVDNQRSDLYSLGVILYEMLTGTLPFEGDDPTDTITQQINATPTPPALINPNILPAATAVIMRSLAKNPATRYPSAGAMVSSLARALNISITEKPGQPGSQMDTMNNPTYITPARPLGMAPPPSSVSSPLPSALSADGRQTPPASMTPATDHGYIFGTQPSVQPAKNPSSSTPSQPYPVSQPGGPITPMPPTHSPWRSVPDLSTVVPVQPPSPVSPQQRGRRRLLIALIALLIIVLIASGVGTYFAFLPHGNNTGSLAPRVPLVGHAFFISSGLNSTNPESSQGITDKLQINLQKISPPQPGKSYYAWLLNSKTSELKPIILGKLAVNSDGTASLTYPGDAEHTDLLASNTRFLITEEDTSAPPGPSLDPSAWSYYAEFSQKPNPLDPPNNYSLYDHIRHLLAADPKLQGVGLTGGLDIWLFRNTEKILEWSGSARDAWKNKNTASADFIRRQLTRILAYLDGATYYQTDLPGQPLRVDPTIAKVALLEFNVQKQEPPGYLYHIGTRHLHSITQLPDATAEQKALAIQISKAIDNVNTWLQAVRTDALQLFRMTNDQLLGDAGRALLDDLATQANNAFVGQINPFTHQVKEGVVQIHYKIQRLATFDIRACTSSDPCAL
ncbi:MAG: protein kinase domain-containing protein [Ktedonobacteraceae bacterium]